MKVKLWVVAAMLIGLAALVALGGSEPGSLKWKFETGSYVHSSPAIGADGTIHVGSDDYYLYALNPDGSLRWKFKTRDIIYSSPAIGADGTIYVGSDDGNLYAINSSSLGPADSPWPMFHRDIRHTGNALTSAGTAREINSQGKIAFQSSRDGNWEIYVVKNPAASCGALKGKNLKV